MQAEVTVALGQEDDALEVPWQSEDGCIRYYDLRRNPELIFDVTEATGNPALVDLLVNLNSEKSNFQSVKCDTWLSSEMDEEDEGFGATWKYGSYIDAVFLDIGLRSDYEACFAFGESLANLLERAPEMPASAEVVLRRCYFHDEQSPDGNDGFALTLYLLGYGDDPEEAKQRWMIATRLMQAAVQQISAAAAK